MTDGTDGPGSSTTNTEGGHDWQGELRGQSERGSAVTGDADLGRLVQLANAYGLEQELVLTLPGQVLSGTLVSGRTYFDGLAAAVQGDDADDTLRGALATGYRARSKDFEGWGAAGALHELDPDGPADDRLASLPTVAYLHLRDVAVAGVAGGRLPLWRGRLADVVGWSVGSIG
jgi:hypothetical protein